jgi:hypothetical protein
MSQPAYSSYPYDAVIAGNSAAINLRKAVIAYQWRPTCRIHLAAMRSTTPAVLGDACSGSNCVITNPS